MKLKITKLVKTLEPKRGIGKESQKPYCIYGYLIDGELDGKPIEAVKVTTMSEPQGKALVPGYECEANVNKYDADALDLVMPARAPDAAAGGGGYRGGGKSSKWVEPEKYTRDELHKLYDDCVQHAHKALKGVMGDMVDSSAVQAGAATLLIQATKSGIKL
jgi:hypothetical protein